MRFLKLFADHAETALDCLNHSRELPLASGFATAQGREMNESAWNRSSAACGLVPRDIEDMIAEKRPGMVRDHSGNRPSLPVAVQGALDRCERQSRPVEIGSARLDLTTSADDAGVVWCGLVVEVERDTLQADRFAALRHSEADHRIGPMFSHKAAKLPRRRGVLSRQNCRNQLDLGGLLLLRDGTQYQLGGIHSYAGEGIESSE